MADILVVDDQDRVTDVCRRALPEHRWHGPARAWDEVGDHLARSRIDLVLLDVHFDLPAERLLGLRADPSPAALEACRRRQGLEILAALRDRWPDLPVVLTTSREELDLASGTDEEYTYFLGDDGVDAQSLRAQIASIAGRRAQEADGPVWWGPSPKMRRIRQKLEVLARGRLPVVLLGPTGTGKSLIARSVVHARSGRSGRFVAVDLSTLPRDLCAAHLFGVVRGAYTGAVSDRAGAFEAADGGTLFLDEIGNLSPDAQKMLLQVLQSGTVTRLGDLKEREVDVKVVVATNEDLRARVASGAFRADLFMRFNPATAVELPPLAERGADPGRLLAFVLRQALERPYLKGLVERWAEAAGSPGARVEVGAGGRVPDQRPGVLHLWFPPRSTRRLAAHDWPGNLREFAMVAENAALFALTELDELAPGERPDVVQVRPKLVDDLLASTAPTPLARAADDPPRSTTGDDAWRFTVEVRPDATLNKVAVEVERQYFVALWKEHRGDFGVMARVLLGGPEHARKVQLRFNQLGLKVRDLREGDR